MVRQIIKKDLLKIYRKQQPSLNEGPHPFSLMLFSYSATHTDIVPLKSFKQLIKQYLNELYTLEKQASVSAFHMLQ